MPVELMLNTATKTDARPRFLNPARIAAHDDTPIYFDCRHVDATYAHLRAHGVNCEGAKIAHYGMKQLYVGDPDG